MIQFCLRILLLIIIPYFSEGRLYFIHIPKTGGTTLRFLLEAQLSVDQIYPYRNPFQQLGPVSHELVSGHFPYWFCKQIDPKFEESYKVTILREPIERFLSFLRAKKRAEPLLPNLQSLLHLKKYKKDFVDNGLCRHLCTNPNLEGEALLESAKEALLTLDSVLFFESFTQDVLALFQHLGVDLHESDIPLLNNTNKTEVSNQLLEEIRNLNLLDLQLYEFARSHFKSKDTSYILRNHTFDRIIQKSNFIDYTFDQPLNGKDWSYREVGPSTYRWVMDKPATIYFSLDEGNDYGLYFSALPAKTEIFPRVKINDVEIELLQIDKNEFSTYYGRVPADLIKATPTQLSFFSLTTFPYGEIFPQKKNRNYFPLAFAISKIQIIKRD